MGSGHADLVSLPGFVCHGLGTTGPGTIRRVAVVEACGGPGRSVAGSEDASCFSMLSMLPAGATPGDALALPRRPGRSPPDAGARRGGGPGHDSSVGQTWRRPIRGEGGPGRRWRGAGLFRHLISDAMPGAARERQSFPDDGVVENALNCQKSVSRYDDRQAKSS